MIQFSNAISFILKPPKISAKIFNNLNLSLKQLLLTYIIPISLIPVISGIIGYSLFGIEIKGTTTIIAPSIIYLWGVIYFLLMVMKIFFIAALANSLSKKYEIDKNFNSSLKASILFYLPVCVFGITNIYPAITLIGVIGTIISAYYLYIALETIKGVEKGHLLSYSIVIYVSAIVISIILSSITNSIIYFGTQII